MAERAQQFSSRWGLMLAMLGMAVGTGNIWRFPRIAASNGGGSFLVAWVVFLFLWSVPLILLEFAMGKATRRSTVGSFRHFLGDRFAWMGGFVAWSAAGISFYYAVVMGWTIRYFFFALTGRLNAVDSQQAWDRFSYSPAALLFHFLAVALAVWVVMGGVSGIERAARILMPALIVLVVVLALRAVTLPGASAGLEFLFRPTWSELGNYRIWLEALTQNAWDTGAGWGLVLTYAIYTRAKEDTNLNAVTLAFGNNAMSLLAGIMVLCTVFSFVPAAQAAASLKGQTNEGLTFIWIPQLFDQMPGGGLFMTIFFLALVFAAWTSLVALFELVTRILVEMGYTDRRKGVLGLGVVVWLAGIPSALSQAVFANQDFVWSVALMLCGLFFAVAVLRYGVTRFRREFINNEHQDLRIGAWWDWTIRLVVVEAAVLVVWWMWQVRNSPPLARDGIGNLMLQWGAVLAALILANRWLVRKLESRAAVSAQAPPREPAPR
ncbi:MAG TPA: sodium-dependent transporter [Thermoanaerobaculia bacterium]|nr:sodium-dependent transporter [Thermoanaerobaculia bacterium]